MAFLRYCYRQILGPRRHLPKFSNGLCRHAGACIRFNAHFGWQAAESYVERSNVFALILGHRVLADCLVGAPPISLTNSRRSLPVPPRASDRKDSTPRYAKDCWAAGFRSGPCQRGSKSVSLHAGVFVPETPYHGHRCVRLRPLTHYTRAAWAVRRASGSASRTGCY